MNITKELAQLYRLVATPGLSQLIVRPNMVGELTLIVKDPDTGNESSVVLTGEDGEVDLISFAPLAWFVSTNSLFAAVRQGLLSVLVGDEIPDDIPDLPLVPTQGEPILSPFGAERGDMLTFDGKDWILLTPGSLGQVLTAQGSLNLPVWSSTGGGAGDVVGPNGAPATAIPKFLGTSGKAIQASSVLIDAIGNLLMNGARVVGVAAPIDPNDAVNKTYVDALLGPDSWRHTALALGLTTPPSSPTNGDRYVIGTGATGAWAGHDNEITTWNGTAWSFDSPVNGWVITIANSATIYRFTGTAWVDVSTSIHHGDLIGLGDDDHTQYIRIDGARAMSGNLDMGGNNVTNVGLVDGVDVSGHAARHLPGGADALATASAVGLSATTTNTEGNAASFARSNHTHAVAVGGATVAIAPDNAAGAGTSANLVREDHVHAVSTAAPVATGTANAAGSANTLARSDHVHRSTVAIAKAGTAVGARPAINFTGAGVTITDDNANDRVTIDIATPGSGDVNGPASSVANTIPKFGDVTGKNLVGSAVVIDASDNIVMGGKKVTGLGTPTDGADATNKSYVDGALAAKDHGTLTGLGDDDHVQYLPVNGTRAMGANLNMGTHDITNVGLVDGVDVSAHAARHAPGGADPLATASAVGLSATTTNTEGTGVAFARNDHTHAILANVAASSVTPATTNTTGSSAAVARADHTHALPSAAAVGLTAASTNAAGSAATVARSDHTHAIATGGATAATAPNNTAGAGTSNNLAREDHAHALTTAAPVATGVANAVGTANSVSRSDHVHRTEVGVQAAGVAVASRPTFDFVGPIVSVTDDPVNDKVIVTIVGGTGSGDVTGPAGATANAVVLFDGATGKLLKNSTVTIAAGDLDIGGGKLTSVGTPTAPTDAATKGYVDGKVYDHGGLSGLGDDDHTQYLLVNGTRAMGAALDMGGFAITNVGLVDGVDVSAHAARHLPSGADPLTTASAVGLSATTTNTTGTANSLARSDHTHAISMGTATAAIAGGNVAGGGSATGLARIDHVHAVTTGAPVTTGIANAAGSGAALALANHVHRVEVAVAKDGTAVTSRPAFNFVGAGVVVADDAGGDRTTVTIAANLVGPATATDNALAVFDGATGKLLKNSPFLLSGSDLSLGGNKLISIATPTNATDAANKDYVDTKVYDHGGLAGLTDDDHVQYLLVDGSRAMGADLDMGTHKVLNVVDPTAPADAANKSYVDGLLTTLTPAAVTNAAAVVGVSTKAARSDHKHSISVGAPVAIGSVNSAGSATSLVASDHVHAHGSQTDGTMHAAATTSVAGFLSASDKTKLDGVASGATATPLTASAPANVTKAAAAVGVATDAARSDHKHDIATAAAVAATIGAANGEGTATTMARSDHTHAIAAGTPVAVGTANAAGSAATFARSDHVHDHGSQAGGALHAAVTTSVNGFMLATDKVKIDGVASGATNTPLTASAPVAITKATAVVGVATDAARSDHKHDVSTAVVVSIGSANAEGSSTALARADHVHDHGAQAGGTAHAVATTSVAGFLSATDKTKLDGVATGATNTALASTAPADVTKAAAAVGVGTTAARADHKHDISTAAPTVGIGTGNAEGTSTAVARADHNHALRLNGVDVTFGAVANGQALALSGTSIIGVDTSGDPPAWKIAVRAATLGNITLSAPQTVDGVAVVAGDRVLVKGQTTGAQNGIYTVNAGAWTRTSDYDTTAEVTSGSAILVQNGTANGNTIWTLSTTNPITVGTTSLIYVLVGVSGVAPANVTKATASAGTSNLAARSDHKHDITTAAASAATVGAAAAEGVSTAIARADHVHTMTTAAPVAIGAANSAGSSGNFVHSDHVHDHGSQTVGTHHAAVTTSVNGFMSAADKVKLDGVATGATAVALTASAPVNVTKAAAAVGVATDAARADHKHDIATATAVSLTMGGANAEGSSTSMARADHTHALPGYATPVAVGTANAAGAATTVARSDHVHEVPFTAVNAALATANAPINVAGQEITSLADASASNSAVSLGQAQQLVYDLVDSYAHKNNVRLATTANITLSGTPTIDGVATTSGDRILVKDQTTGSQNGIYAVALGSWGRQTDANDQQDFNNGQVVYVQAGAANSNTVWALTTPPFITVGTTALAYALVNANAAAPANITKATATAGTANFFSRVDHKHDVTTAAPSTIGTANTEGSASALARADHVHDHGSQGGGALHAVATTSVAGFLSAADKVKIDGAAVLASTAPADVTKATASVGVGTTAARADHKHDIATAAPSNIGTTNTEGSSTSMARADHIHALPFSAVNSALAAANAPINMNGQQVTNIGAPVAGNDAATLDAVNARNFVRVATIADITLSGTQTIDGVAVIAGDRVLAKNQLTPTLNGIWVVASGVWSRALDADSSSDFTAGLVVTSREGTVNKNTLWTLATTGAITPGSTPLSFVSLQQKTITSGTLAPTGGVDGDIYLQYT